LVENIRATWEAYINVDIDAAPLQEDLNQTTPTKDESDGTLFVVADLDKVLGCAAGVYGSAATVHVVLEVQRNCYQGSVYGSGR
jgi:hypothetical protein